MGAAFKLEYLFATVSVAEAKKVPADIAFAREEAERLMPTLGTKGSELRLAGTVTDKLSKLPRPGVELDNGGANEQRPPPPDKIKKIS